MHKDRADSYEKSLCLTKENGVVRNKWTMSVNSDVTNSESIYCTLYPDKKSEPQNKLL